MRLRKRLPFGQVGFLASFQKTIFRSCAKAANSDGTAAAQGPGLCLVFDRNRRHAPNSAEQYHHRGGHRTPHLIAYVNQVAWVDRRMHAETKEMRSKAKHLGRGKRQHHRRLMFPVQTSYEPTSRRQDWRID